ncbi:MAG: hypothetical protein ABIP63_04420 [Thermoanaerobaculia bacterium]
MRNTVTDVLRRSFDITLANWPLILIRIAEAVVLTMICIVSGIVAIVPLLVSAGFSKDDISRTANPAEAVAALLVGHWMLLAYLILFVTFVAGLIMALHSFVQGGSAQIYVDAERGSGRASSPVDRSRFAAFRMDRWMLGGRKSWRSIFWIYNLGGSVGALIILIPLLLTIAAMVLLGDAQGKIIAGCAGLLLALLVLLPVGIIVSMWCEKAIAVTVARAASPRDSLRAAWAEMKADFGRHFAVAILITIAGFVLFGAMSALSFPMAMGSRNSNLPMLSLMFAPVQIAMTLIQGAVSAVSSALMLAAFVDLTEER